MIRGSLRDFSNQLPRIKDLRVTPYTVRKEIMGSLGNLIAGANILDLFAGSGSLGLEALNYGALRTTFVDIDDGCIRNIRNLLKMHHLEGRGRVYKGSANAFVEKSSHGEYDIIFFTPPYLNLHLYLIPKVRRIIKDRGLMVFEHPPTLTAPKLEKEARHFKIIKDCNYGWSRITFLIPKPS